MTDRELNKNRVMWCDVQLGLSETGLNLEVYPFPENGTWKGELDGKPFTMTIPPKSDNGHRNYAIVSLYGQDESVINGFSKFMEYDPCLKYRKKSTSIEITNYEWWIDKQQQEKSLRELSNDSKYFDLIDLRNNNPVK